MINATSTASVRMMPIFEQGRTAIATTLRKAIKLKRAKQPNGSATGNNKSVSSTGL
jgi:hypothetical protein